MDVTKKNILSTLKKMKKHERSATYFKKIFTQASKEGLNINERYEQGKNILHYTIEGGYDNLINFFIKLGLNPDICDDNFVSPLHLAVNKNNKKAVKKLSATSIPQETSRQNLIILFQLNKIIS